MKKHFMTGTALALAVAVGATLPGLAGTAFAESHLQNSAKNDINVNVDADLLNLEDGPLDCGFIEDEDYQEKYINQLLSDGFITSAEAEKLRETEKEIDKLYDQIDELYEGVDEIYKKASESIYYNEFIDKNILTAEEVKTLKQANDEINALYDNIENMTEQDINALMQKEEVIRKKYKAIYDKIDAYHKAEEIKDRENFYQSLIDDAILTKEQVKQLKDADAKVNALYEGINENMTDEELEAVYKKGDEIYGELDFLDEISAYWGNPKILE